MILSTTLVLGSFMTVGFVGSSITQRESWSVQYAAPEPVPGAAFGVQPAAYEPPGEDVQLGRVVRMLDRSDEVLGSEGAVSELVLQARSELGMLLATYQAQQVVEAGGASGAQEQPPAVQPPGDLPDAVPAAPGVPAPPAPAAPPAPGAPAAPADPADPAEQGAQPTVPPPALPSTSVPEASAAANPVEPSAAPSPGSGTTDAPAPETGQGPLDDPAGTGPGAPADTLDDPSGTFDDPAGAPGQGAADGFDPETGLPAAPTDDGAASPSDDESAGHDGLVTIDDVVAAATRLAELMGPAYALAAVGVVPADGVVPETGTLADQLAAAVAKYADSTAQYGNGQLPDSALCPLAFAPGQSLRCDAAEQLDALAVEYQKAFGKPLRITDSYRSYEDQVAVKAAKPFLAAVPGTSQHGWGLAIDVGSPVSTGTSAEYQWMRLHAPDYGWDNPTWARPGGRKPEPWHFEFYAAGAMPDRYTPGAEGTPTAPVVPDAPARPTPPPAVPAPSVPAPAPSPTTPAPTDPPTTPDPTPTTPVPTDPPTTPVPTPTPTPTPDPTPTTPVPTDPPTTPAPSPTSPAPTETSAAPSISPTDIPSQVPGIVEP